MSHMLNDNKKKFFLSCDHCQTGFSKGAQITHETLESLGTRKGDWNMVFFQHLKYALLSTLGLSCTI